MAQFPNWEMKLLSQLQPVELFTESMIDQRVLRISGTRAANGRHLVVLFEGNSPAYINFQRQDSKVLSFGIDFTFVPTSAAGDFLELRRANWRPGDIVFYENGAALYVGPANGGGVYDEAFFDLSSGELVDIRNAAPVILRKWSIQLFSENKQIPPYIAYTFNG